jgi:hypothetical protein
MWVNYNKVLWNYRDHLKVKIWQNPSCLKTKSYKPYFIPKLFTCKDFLHAFLKGKKT